MKSPGWKCKVENAEVESSRTQMVRLQLLTYRVTQINLKCFLAITLKLCITDPMLVKPKCVREAYNFFDFQLFVYNFQLVVYNFSKKLYASQTHFGFINIGSEMLFFDSTPIYFWWFSIWTYPNMVAIPGNRTWSIISACLKK